MDDKDQITRDIFKLIDNSAMTYEEKFTINSLLFKLKTAEYVAGLNKGTELCKNVYQKTANN